MGECASALNAYEHVLNINSDDEDTKFNYDLVKKLMESNQSQDNQGEEKNNNSNQGSIFLYDLISNKLINLTSNIDFEFHPHGIASYKNLNGELFISAINHTSSGHFIEVFIFPNCYTFTKH